MTVPEMYDWHFSNNRDHPVFVYSTETDTVTLSYSTVVPAIHEAGKLAESLLGADMPKVPLQCSPIAIISSADTITFFCTILGILRCGIPVFPISPRNTSGAIAHLLRSTGVKHILAGQEAVLNTLLQEVIQKLHLDTPDYPLPSISAMPVFEDLFNDSTSPNSVNRIYGSSYDPQSTFLHLPAIFVHSSGSTSHPKPIPWSHASILQVAMSPQYSAYDLRGEIFGAHQLAMAHPSGLNYLAWVAGIGMIMAVFPPRSPATIPTPANVIDGLKSCKATFIICVPSFPEV
ncbi:hypothetical protein M422DRAFT_260947, partial [Sphaerobolus stellatus SS14]